MEEAEPKRFRVMELTKVLDRDHRQAMVIEENVPEGATVMASFESDQAIELSIRTVTNRKKLYQFIWSPLYFPLDMPKSMDADKWKEDGEIVRHTRSRTWTQGLLVDELEDVQLVASLPDGYRTATVTIKAYLLQSK